MPDERLALRADCSRCAALCCVAPAFAASSDFAIDKPAGVPCPNLLDDFRCGVHDRLRPLGFAGCTVYDCFGAGQHTVQQVYGGRSWRDEDVDPREMFDVFGMLRGLHELLWLLAEVRSRAEAADLHEEASRLTAEVRAATEGAP
ncbi:MAG: pentapeptide repeat-containing protein, partial [Nocardioidaceae bacterium]|nr:pentapeptide repeat-containing protein [Nocardioidaceae bacterium]